MPPRHQNEPGAEPRSGLQLLGHFKKKQKKETNGRLTRASARCNNARMQRCVGKRRVLAIQAHPSLDKLFGSGLGRKTKWLEVSTQSRKTSACEPASPSPSLGVGCSVLAHRLIQHWFADNVKPRFHADDT